MAGKVNLHFPLKLVIRAELTM